MHILKDVKDEFIMIFKGKTLDTFFSPIVFYIVYNLVSLEWAIVGSVTYTTVVFFYRKLKRQNSFYATFGLVFVVIAASLAYINQNSTNYFLPGIISNLFILLVSLFSILFEKPLAAYLSHITRGWPMAWFERKDIKPAYMEVTFFWLFMFFIRSMAEIYFYFVNYKDGLIALDTIIGMPALLIVLALSYIYGIFRLNSLKGPSVDEFLNQVEPPFKGQKKGF